jgi:SAM-dependent methyltransferase
MSRVHKTFDEFWGPLLLVRFHEEHPGRWSIRHERAAWIFKQLELSEGCRILDLGCGDGVLDSCLADLGAEVTGVDRIASVLDQAEEEAGERSVTFVCGDLRNLMFDAGSFDAVLLFEVVGLMDVEEDEKLIASVHHWLRPGGALLVDCPRKPTNNNHTWERDFDDGTLRSASSFDESTRLQHIDPTFERKDGVTIDMVDPYARTRGDYTGIMRYLYPVDRLTGILASAGFTVEQVQHYSTEERYLLCGRKS